MQRATPDGGLLSWRLTLGGSHDGLVPFLIDWLDSPHPSTTTPRGATLVALRGEHPDAAAVVAAHRALGWTMEVREGPVAALVATIDAPERPARAALTRPPASRPGGRAEMRRCGPASSSSAASRCPTPGRAARLHRSALQPGGDVASDRAAGRPRRRLRAAGLRRLLADRAPLPARGLRGRAQRDPLRRHARGADLPHPHRHDVQHRPPVAPAAAGRGLRLPPQRLRRAGALRGGPGHGAPGGARRSAPASAPSTTPTRPPPTGSTASSSTRPIEVIRTAFENERF